MATSAEANSQLLVLRMNIKRNIEPYEEKLEYTKKKLYLAAYLLAFFYGLGTMDRINQKSK